MAGGNAVMGRHYFQHRALLRLLVLLLLVVVLVMLECGMPCSLSKSSSRSISTWHFERERRSRVGGGVNLLRCAWVKGGTEAPLAIA